MALFLDYILSVASGIGVRAAEAVIIFVNCIIHIISFVLYVQIDAWSNGVLTGTIVTSATIGMTYAAWMFASYFGRFGRIAHLGLLGVSTGLYVARRHSQGDPSVSSK